VVPRNFRSLEEKQAILADARASGGSVAAIARKYGVNANLIFAWMRLEEQGLLQARTRSAPPKLLAVTVVPEAATEPEPAATASPREDVEIVLPDGICVRVHGAVPSEQIDRVLRLLRR
jgi:transposase-like protein